MRKAAYTVDLGENKVFRNAEAREAYILSFLCEHLCLGGHFGRQWDDTDVTRAWYEVSQMKGNDMESMSDFLLETFVHLMFQDSDVISDDDAAIIDSIKPDLTEYGEWFVYAH